jgi:hypothetical protein
VGVWCERDPGFSCALSRPVLVSIAIECVFLAVERLAAVPDPSFDGASVAIESIAIIVAPAIVHDTACRIPAIVSTMLAMLPSSITGLEAKGSSVPLRLLGQRPLTGSKHDCNERGWIKWRS